LAEFDDVNDSGGDKKCVLRFDWRGLWPLV
jgi:hypothetical protein